MGSVHDVYRFNDPIDYLNYRLRERRKSSPAFSVSEWSRRLGYANPSFLSQILKRERKLKPDLAARLAADLKLQGRAREYFECTVLNESSDSAVEKRVYADLMQKMKPKRLQSQRELSLETFALIADWYHTALLEMLQLKGFTEDAETLRRALDPKLSLKSVRSAMKRLTDLGFWERDERGRLRRPAQEPNVLNEGVPSEAVRLYHQQILERAKAAVTEQSLDERFLRGTTVAIKTSDMARASQILREAHEKILGLAAHGDGDELYQFNTQFFRLTKKRGGLS